MEELLRLLDEFWSTHEATKTYDIFDHVFDMHTEEYEEVKEALLVNNFVVDYQINASVSSFLNDNGYIVSYKDAPHEEDPYMYYTYVYIISKDDKKYILELVKEPQPI